MKIPAGDLFVAFFFAIGLTFCAISYHFYRSGEDLIANGIKAKGIVVGMHRIKRLEFPIAPSVRFFTQDGKEHVWHSSDGRNPPAYFVGQEVTLHYNPNDPDDVILENDKLLVYVFGGMGLVFMFISVWGIGSAVRNIWNWIFGGSSI
jgi:hypothetical protein